MALIVNEKDYSSALNFLRSDPVQKLLREPFRFSFSQFSTAIVQRLNKYHRLKATTFWGEKMWVVIPEPVSITIQRYGLYEPGLTLTLMRYLKPGQVFVDVGAHFGYFTLLAATLMGDSGEVHSFEPTLSTFAILNENSQRRGNVHTNNIALWSETDTMEFKDYGLRFSAFNSFYDPRLRDDARPDLRFERHLVSTMPLDQYVSQNGVKPDFVKIDAESSELRILQGMEKILSQDKPLVSLEVGDEDVAGIVQSRDLVCFLLERGYCPFEMTDSGVIPHELLERYRPSNLLFIPEDAEIAA